MVDSTGNYYIKEENSQALHAPPHAGIDVSNASSNTIWPTRHGIWSQTGANELLPQP